MSERCAHFGCHIYVPYLNGGYKAFILNMETIQVVSSAERPHRPVEWVDQR